MDKNTAAKLARVVVASRQPAAKPNKPDVAAEAASDVAKLAHKAAKRQHIMDAEDLRAVAISAKLVDLAYNATIKDGVDKLLADAAKQAAASK